MGTLYTYTFETYENGVIHANHSVPMRGFDNEEEAWDAFTNMGFYMELADCDYWAGYAILSPIVCDETQEESS